MTNNLHPTRRDIIYSLAGAVGIAGTANGASGADNHQSGNRESHSAQTRNLSDFIQGREQNIEQYISRQNQQSLANKRTIQAVGLAEQWRKQINEPTVITFTLRPGSSGNEPVYLVGGDQSSIQSQGTIYALERDDGSVRWSETTSGLPIISIGSSSSLYYTTGGLRVGSPRVVALSQNNGTELWRHTSELPQSSFQIIPAHVPSDSTLYVITQGLKIIALNDSTGTARWSSQSQTGIQSVAFQYNQSLSTGFIAGFELSQASTSRSGYIRAVDLTNQGAQDWLKQRPYPVSGIPLVDGNTVFQPFSRQQTDDSSNVDTELVAFDATDGNVRWSDERTDGLLYSFMLDDQSSVYIDASRNTASGSEGVVVKFEKSSGDLVWEYDAGGQVLGLDRDSDRVYIATRPGEVMSIVDDPTSPDYGRADWSQSLNAGIRDAGLEKAGNVLYTGTISDPGTVYAINAIDGSIISSQQVFSGYLSPIIADDGAIWTAGSGQVANSSTVENDPSYAYKLTGQGDSNTPPTPSFSVTPRNPTVGESVTLDASGSSDPDGSIQGYEWDLDDDSIYEQVGQQISHSFPDSGDQTVLLRVTDNSGTTATASQTVTVTSGTGSGGAWFDDYVNQNDVVDPSGLNSAIGDYLSGNLSDSRLNSIIGSYLGSSPIQG